MRLSLRPSANVPEAHERVGASCRERAAGAAAVPDQGKRDASRLLSHGALAVQRVLGISAEPLLTPPG